MNLLGFDIAEIPTVAVRQVITTDSCVGALALPLLLPGFRLRRGRFRASASSESTGRTLSVVPSPLRMALIIPYAAISETSSNC